MNHMNENPAIMIVTYTQIFTILVTALIGILNSFVMRKDIVEVKF